MILSFDTSNYTTSVALIADDGSVKGSFRKMLTVKEGERGLRQSDAFFQHGKNLPELIGELTKGTGALSGCITALSCSDRPRSRADSYMPCFLAGLEQAETLSHLLGVPLFRFSHQEGHMAAASHGTILEKEQRYLAWHLSGGTCELLLWDNREGGTLLGGTKDISFGQILDRTGVLLGLPFPAGKYIDRVALTSLTDTSSSPETVRNKGMAHLTRIRTDGFSFNLSGMETQIIKEIEGGKNLDSLALPILLRTTEAIATCTKAACLKTGIRSVLFAGGVSSSLFLRNELENRLDSLSIAFGEPSLSSDNAVGVGLLGYRAFQNLRNAKKGGDF